jgi:hypothetical protein
MEARFVPSLAGGAIPAAHVIAARVAKLEAHANHKAAEHAAHPHAVARHQHLAKHAPAVHHVTSASSHKTSQPSNFFSNFFHSIFGMKL